MSGTRIGGIKAAKRNRELYGDNFYRTIGSKGGQHSTNGGFASYRVGKDGLTGHQRAKIAGAKGGRTSRRTGIAAGQGKEKEYIWKGEPDEELIFS